MVRKLCVLSGTQTSALWLLAWPLTLAILKPQIYYPCKDQLIIMLFHRVILRQHLALNMLTITITRQVSAEYRSVELCSAKIRRCGANLLFYQNSFHYLVKSSPWISSSLADRAADGCKYLIKYTEKRFLILCKSFPVAFVFLEIILKEMQWLWKLVFFCLWYCIVCSTK